MVMIILHEQSAIGLCGRMFVPLKFPNHQGTIFGMLWVCFGPLSYWSVPRATCLRSQYLCWWKGNPVPLLLVLLPSWPTCIYKYMYDKAISIANMFPVVMQDTVFDLSFMDVCASWDLSVYEHIYFSVYALHVAFWCSHPCLIVWCTLQGNSWRLWQVWCDGRNRSSSWNIFEKHLSSPMCLSSLQCLHAYRTHP